MRDARLVIALVGPSVLHNLSSLLEKKINRKLKEIWRLGKIFQTILNSQECWTVGVTNNELIYVIMNSSETVCHILSRGINWFWSVPLYVYTYAFQMLQQEFWRRFHVMLTLHGFLKHISSRPCRNVAVHRLLNINIVETDINLQASWKCLVSIGVEFVINELYQTWNHTLIITDWFHNLHQNDSYLDSQ